MVSPALDTSSTPDPERPTDSAGPAAAAEAATEAASMEATQQMPVQSGGPETRTLAADVGSVFTKVYLLQEVEGERRLIAVGRSPTIDDTGCLAVEAALQQATYGALAYAGQRERPDGPPRVLMTSVAAVPRIAIVAPRAEDARAVAAALDALPVRVLDPILLEGPAGDPEMLLGQIEALAPDAVVITGSARNGDHRPARGAVEAVARGFSIAAPLIVLAGSQSFVEGARAVLGPVRSVDAAGDADRAATAAREAARELIRERLGTPDLRSHAVAGWEEPVSSSLEGVCAATELIAERYDVDVLTLDLGASHAMAVTATGTAGQRRLAASVRDDLGLRYGRLQLLRQVGAAQVNRWLPGDLDEVALLADARRCLALPAGLPDRVDDLLLDHAFAREALRLAIQGHGAGTAGQPLPPIDLLIGSGGALASVPRLMQAALILLDAAQPEALTQLALDRATALPLLGQIGLHEGAASLGAALERDGLLNLGLCIAPVGSGREGETAIRVEVAYANRSPVSIEVPFGAIEVVPLPIGDRAALKLWPAKEFDIGLGKGNAATPRSEVEGGAVGIIVDARGRPLAMPDAPEKRQAKLLQWLQATHAYPHLSFVQPPAAGSEPEP